MKSEIIFLITAEKVIIEQLTEKPTIIGVFQDVVIPSNVGSVIIPITVFAKVSNLEGDISAKISILDPANKESQSVTINGMSNKKQSINLRGIFHNFIFNEVGVYKIKILVNGDELNFHPDHIINVSKAK